MPKITYESMGYSEHLKARESMKNLGAELEQISKQDRLNVNMHDPRANSNNCLFDLFVMANHDIAFKDIRAFQKMIRRNILRNLKNSWRPRPYIPSMNSAEP